MIIQKNVLTIATGKKIYVGMAINLARSFRIWNRENGVDFYLATDQPELLPADLNSYVKIISLQADELGKGFSPKLHLDKLAPAGQTLFIDSDCLVYGDLNPVFEKFRGHAVSVIGNYANNGEWFGDVSAICEKLGIAKMPKFNGGIYYLENGPAAKKVYNLARKLENEYDETGFVRLRGRPNDEVLVAVAMELNRQQPIPDDGNFFAELLNFQSGLKSDVLTGKALVFNNPGSELYQPDWALTEGKPIIVHFLGDKNQSAAYLKECRHLDYYFVNKYPVAVLRALTFLNTTLPIKLKTGLKNIFRPIYRTMFGLREVKKSERVVD